MLLSRNIVILIVILGSILIYLTSCSSTAASSSPKNADLIIIDNNSEGITTDASKNNHWVQGTPNIIAAGTYDIYLNWPANQKLESLPVEIKYKGGSKTLNINKELNTGTTWYKLGTFNLSAGKNNYVKLLTSQGDTVVDAVQFVPTDYAKSKYPKLALSDDFDGSTLDTTKWDYRHDTKLNSSQRAENVTVNNGILHIAQKKEEFNGKHYTGGGVISKQKFKYGYYEARIKLPLSKGWHNSFWALPYNGSDTNTKGLQEIDGFEHDGPNNVIRTNIHEWNQHKDYQAREQTLLNLNNWHTYAFEWTSSNEIRWFIDGVMVRRSQYDPSNSHGSSDQNLWITTLLMGLPEDNNLPSTLDVDYVHVYTS